MGKQNLVEKFPRYPITAGLLKIKDTEFVTYGFLTKLFFCLNLANVPLTSTAITPPNLAYRTTNSQEGWRSGKGDVPYRDIDLETRTPVPRETKHQ